MTNPEMHEEIKKLADSINPSNYTYHLPEQNIAKYPAKERGQSKLLVYHNNTIEHKQFGSVTDHIPGNSLLVFNNTKVIPARIIFQKSTGAHIEIFLLEPISPSRIMSEAMSSKRNVVWKCMVGNAKKWKDDITLERKSINEGKEFMVTASWVDRSNQEVSISWDQVHLSFADILQNLGQVPLPPYIDRDLDEKDPVRYQTVYSKVEGAVAAPTAGLHFTEKIIANLKAKNVTTDELTLHVSAGTFQPLKAEKITDHPMHSEQVVVTQKNILNILDNQFVTAVGTTSMRTLESTYWYGVKLLENQDAVFFIEKLYPYKELNNLPSKDQAFKAVLSKMDVANTDYLIGNTEIFIFPGYEFKVCQGLITNFHLPGSTLILLVAAFVGEQWAQIYNEALEKDYKFLSYGDSSVLIK